MRLWTVQSEEAFRELMERGILRADPARIALLKEDQIRRAYDWLAAEMEKRIGKKPPGVSYPVWAYALYQGEKKEPERWGFGDPGDRMVMICLEAEDADVLLSDFYSWHCVLNDTYIPECQTEEEFDRDWDRHHLLPQEEREKEKKASWQKIFDIRPAHNGFIENGLYVQAVFWELRKEQIVSFEHFTVPEEEEEGPF